MTSGPVTGTRPLRVVLGVGGGIAAYKAADLLRRFSESGHDVTVVPTRAALHFVGAATWSALSGKPVSAEVWDDVADVPHVRLGQQADLVVVAPATADLLARAAAGLADDLLTNVLLTARCPVVMAPAMHTEMWQHPATRANVATLRAPRRRRPRPRRRPAHRRRLRPRSPAEPARDLRRLPARCSPAGAADLLGRTVVVSAGGTREHLDPVRFLGNRSSGKQGYALAATAAARGATVVLVSANVALPDPAGVTVVRGHVGRGPPAGRARPRGRRRRRRDGGRRRRLPARSRSRVTRSRRTTPGECPPRSPSSAPPTSSPRWSRTATRPAARRWSSGSPPRPATPTATVLDHGRAKLARKGCDLLVVNEVGDGPRRSRPTTTRSWSSAPTAPRPPVERASKAAIADAVWDRVGALPDRRG